MIDCDILFSSSRGNSVYIHTKETKILIDCGKSARTVKNALRDCGTDIDEIDAIFITHEHSDHTSALNIISKSVGIDIHVTAPSSVRLMREEYSSRRLIVHPVEYEVKIKDLTVKSFPLPHDSAAHVGYVITDSENDTLGIATDMGYVTDTAKENLSMCRRVVIESNHDIDMLKSGPYPKDLKKRILSKKGHLSNENCSVLSCILASKGCRGIALAHLSPENNTPDYAYGEARRALDAEGFGNVYLTVCDPEQPVHFPGCI